MTKYIHYKELHQTGVLISDKIDETQSGYVLGLEIECSCFNSVLRLMTLPSGILYSIQGNVITNVNLIGFKNDFMRCMDTIGQFSAEKYIIRVIHPNSTVTWYRRETLPKL